MPLNTTFSYFGKLLVFTLLPYAVPYIALQYVVPIILKTLGFGLKGILLHSIASWIQSNYGTSYLFSLLQSIGARGGNLYPKFWSGIIGTYKLIESYTKRLSSRVSTSTLKDFDMEQINRQFNNSLNNYDARKRQKIQRTTDDTDRLSEETVTSFEDLSNEVVYEIFEFLDYFHVYEAFFNLNQRFYNLLTHSNLPIKINFSSMSKSALKRYNTNIIQTNIHRISSLHFSNVFMHEFVLSSIGKLSKFSRVETLILENIEYACLRKLLDELPSLSVVSSLVISSVDSVKDKNTVYRQIFRLPALKYCKLSLKGWDYKETLPVSINEYSSIKHLIITNYIYLHQLDSLLSYVPQLRRLSFHLVTESRSEQKKIFPRLLNHLTHISLETSSIKFDQFEQLFVNLFSNVKVLHFTVIYDMDPAYMDANKWKQLILSHAPNLRIFDIRQNIWVKINNSQTTIEDAISQFECKMKQFESPFWIERQWFFEHDFYSTEYANCALVYSTNPYRRKDYILCKKLGQNISVHHSGSKVDSVQHVRIPRKQSITNYRNYFPNAVELTFDDNFSAPPVPIVITLNRIIHLKQLTKLTIKCHRFSIRKVIKILCHSPSIHTLILQSMPCYQKVNDYTSIKESEDFQLVSNTNVIKTVTCEAEYTLEQMKFLVALCPRIEHLIINTLSKNLKPIIQFLLNKTNPNAHHLCSVCFSIACNNWLKKVDTIIKSEATLDDYMLKQVGWKLYLWW